MNNELFAVYSIAVCVLLLGGEYLWLTVAAKKQEKISKKYTLAEENIRIIIKKIFSCGEASVIKEQITLLNELMNGDIQILDIIDSVLYEFEDKSNYIRIADEIHEFLEPKKLYFDMLNSGDKHKLGYACRKLADHGAREYTDEIYSLSKSKDRNIAYNAAMALSVLGFSDGVCEYILEIENDRGYSFRIVREIFSVFGSDRAVLAERILKNCGNHMKAVVIKAITPYGLKGFYDIFIEGLESKDINMRVACVKALGLIAEQQDEEILLIAANDSDWQVRSAAIKGISKFDTDAAVQCVKNAVGDSEWWVRRSAANTLVNMNVSSDIIEDILYGDDKYAAEALKYALSRSMLLKEA